MRKLPEPIPFIKINQVLEILKEKPEERGMIKGFLSVNDPREFAAPELLLMAAKMKVKFSKKELNDIRAVFEDREDIKEIVNAFEELSEIYYKLKYPINSREELIEQVGDKEAKIGGKAYRIDDLVRFIPASIFPIVSDKNLVEKAEDALRMARKTPDVTRLRTGQTYVSRNRPRVFMGGRP